jgi:glutathione S-transferase
MKGQPSNEAMAEDGLRRLSANLDIFEKVLSKQKYMGGKDFSLIDIFYMPTVRLLYSAGQGHLFEERQNIKAWWETVSNRDTWKQVTVA